MSSKYDIEGAKKILRPTEPATPGTSSQIHAAIDELFDALAEAIKVKGWQVYPGVDYEPASLRISTGDGFMVVRRDNDGTLSITNGNATTRLDGAVLQQLRFDWRADKIVGPYGADALHVLVHEIVRIRSTWSK